MTVPPIRLSIDRLIRAHDSSVPCGQPMSQKRAPSQGVWSDPNTGLLSWSCGAVVLRWTCCRLRGFHLAVVRSEGSCSGLTEATIAVILPTPASKTMRHSIRMFPPVCSNSDHEVEAWTSGSDSWFRVGPPHDESNQENHQGTHRTHFRDPCGAVATPASRENAAISAMIRNTAAQ